MCTFLSLSLCKHTHIKHKHLSTWHNLLCLTFLCYFHLILEKRLKSNCIVLFGFFSHHKIKYKYVYMNMSMWELEHVHMSAVMYLLQYAWSGQKNLRCLFLAPTCLIQGLFILGFSYSRACGPQASRISSLNLSTCFKISSLAGKGHHSQHCMNFADIIQIPNICLAIFVWFQMLYHQVLIPPTHFRLSLNRIRFFYSVMLLNNSRVFIDLFSIFFVYVDNWLPLYIVLFTFLMNISLKQLF